jgi:hypothetical protein
MRNTINTNSQIEQINIMSKIKDITTKIEISIGSFIEAHKMPIILSSISLTPALIGYQTFSLTNNIWISIISAAIGTNILGHSIVGFLNKYEENQKNEFLKVLKSLGTPAKFVQTSQRQEDGSLHNTYFSTMEIGTILQKTFDNILEKYKTKNFDNLNDNTLKRELFLNINKFISFNPTRDQISEEINQNFNLFSYILKFQMKEYKKEIRRRKKLDNMGITIIGESKPEIIKTNFENEINYEFR